MSLKKITLGIVAALITMTGAASAHPSRNAHWHYPTGRAVYNSYPVYNSYNYNDRNYDKTNRSSYLRYPSSSSYYYSYPTTSRYYYNNGYSYPSSGYYYRDGYYNDGPSLQLGPVRIDF